MATSTETYAEMKSVFKEALIELMQEQRDYFRDIIKELLDEKELVRQAEQAEAVPLTDRDDPVEQQVQAEIQAYHRLHPLLWQNYPGEYVAIHNQKLVDHDPDKLALYKRIREKYPDEFVLRRQVDEKPERELHLRSTRFFAEAR